MTTEPVAANSLKKHPKRWKWRLEWLAQTALEGCVSRLSTRSAFRLGEAAGGLAWHFMGYRRRLVIRNLRIALHGEHDLPALDQMAREAFRRTGGNLLSAMRSACMTFDEVRSSVVLPDPELVETVVPAGQGAVVMPPHMGNWEILSRINRLLPHAHEMGAFYRPLNNPLLNKRILAQRSAEGTRMFAKREGFHQVSGFLRGGGIVGILADQRVGKQGEIVRFFGRLTRASPLPSLMARRSKCRIFAISLVTLESGKWRVGLHPVEKPIDTASCMAALEQAMRSSPLDVFWFQERWKVYVTPRYTIRDWLGPEAADAGIPGAAEKPHRALLWLAGTDPAWRLPDTWRHRDVIYEVVLAHGQPAPPWLAGDEPLHRVSTAAGEAALQKSLVAIDRAAALPIDYILTCAAPKHLEMVARNEAIRLVSLPAAGS